MNNTAIFNSTVWSIGNWTKYCHLCSAIRKQKHSNLQEGEQKIKMEITRHHPDLYPSGWSYGAVVIDELFIKGPSSVVYAINCIGLRQILTLDTMTVWSNCCPIKYLACHYWCVRMWNIVALCCNFVMCLTTIIICKCIAELLGWLQ